jgi:hypothetical protein
MVTAIVIPIICLYFYWITRREMKVNDQKWLALAEVKKESVLTGQIMSINEEKQRFYYHRYMFIQELKLQTETKRIIAKKISPVRNNVKIDTFSIGDVIRIYGRWEGNHFHFSDFQKVNDRQQINEKR